LLLLRALKILFQKRRLRQCTNDDGVSLFHSIAEIRFNQAAPGGAFVGWQEVPGEVQTEKPSLLACRRTHYSYLPSHRMVEFCSIRRHRTALLSAGSAKKNIH
jgi:hypothetical protein